MPYAKLHVRFMQVDTSKHVNVQLIYERILPIDSKIGISQFTDEFEKSLLNKLQIDPKIIVKLFFFLI